MSTKSTIVSGPGDAFFIEEEMLDETTWLVISRPLARVYLGGDGGSTLIELQLSAELIEAIVKAHGERRFPYQSKKGER